MTYNAAALGTVVRQDWALCQLMLAEEKGVLCIPASPFFSENSQQDENGDPILDQFVWIANDTIQNAAEALMKISESRPQKEEESMSVSISS